MSVSPSEEEGKRHVAGHSHALILPCLPVPPNLHPPTPS